MKTSAESGRYLFKFYYIGEKKFFGSQRQKHHLTIEDCLIKALKKRAYIKDARTSNFEVASRTDRLVSARGAAFSFISKKKPILMELNSILPKEIGIWAYAKVDLNFISRYNAVYRHYKYIVKQPLDIINKNHIINIELMNKACKELEGIHNFSNFSKRTEEETRYNREIISINLNINRNFIIFDFISKAFLRQQVRRMVKKILEVGLGEITYENFLDLFDASKNISYEPADASGLILWDVKFDDSIIFKIDPKSIERMNNFFRSQEIEYGHTFQLFNLLQQNDFR
jgi:tRNA pseudouridine38-40 synthase